MLKESRWTLCFIVAAFFAMTLVLPQGNAWAFRRVHLADQRSGDRDRGEYNARDENRYRGETVKKNEDKRQHKTVNRKENGNRSRNEDKAVHKNGDRNRNRVEERNVVTRGGDRHTGNRDGNRGVVNRDGDRNRDRAGVKSTDRGRDRIEHRDGDRNRYRSQRREAFRKHRPYYHGKVFHKLPPKHRRIWVKKTEYFYYSGIFYRNALSGYVVVEAPIGAIIIDLPFGSLTFEIHGRKYFSYSGVFYEKSPSGYRVVAAPSPETSVAVVANVLNVRSGPSLNSPVVSVVFLDEILEVYDFEHGWLYVKIPDGDWGWVMAKYTEELPPPASG